MAYVIGGIFEDMGNNVEYVSAALKVFMNPFVMVT
jgi:hypothetical protein